MHMQPALLDYMAKEQPEYFRMESKIELTLRNIQKTLGGIGGFVAASKEVVNYLRFYSRSYFFSAALPPCICATVKAAIEVIEEEPERIKQLHKNVKYLHDALSGKGFNVSSPGTGVFSVIIGNELTMRKMSKRIHELGLYINPLPFPSVRKEEARFKFSLMATHTKDDLDEAVDIFSNACNEFNLL